MTGLLVRDSGSTLGCHSAGGGRKRSWLGALLLGAISAAGCTSAKPAAQQPGPSIGQKLSLAVALKSALTVGDATATAEFGLVNNGSATFDGCFGPSWGVSVIIEGGRDAGHLVRADHPSCVEKFTLLPAQKIAWSKKVPLSNLGAGTAKVTGWVKLVDPACDQYRGCHETSIASPLMTVSVGQR
jgi:hypothetical protein